MKKKDFRANQENRSRMLEQLKDLEKELLDWKDSIDDPVELESRFLFVHDTMRFYAAVKEMQLERIARPFFGILKVMMGSPGSGIKLINQLENTLIRFMIKTVLAGKATVSDDTIEAASLELGGDDFVDKERS